MPKSTSRGIQYPLPGDYIKQPNVPSKLAQDIQVVATTTDAAIGAEGARAQSAATQAAINDARSKYGQLPNRIAQTEARNAAQDVQLENHQTRIEAVETLGGLAPGDVSDATMTSLAANPDSMFHHEQAERTSASTGTVNPADHTSFEAAIAHARATGRTLIVDTHLEADSVPREFWEIPVAGKGSVTVGGNKWWVNPQHNGIQTNRLYINPTTGNDLESGIDPAKPIKTFGWLNIVFSMLREKLLDGFWEVVIQAGHHHIDQGWRMDGLRTKWPLVITGEGNQDTIIDGDTDTLGRGFHFKHFRTSVTFRNLVIQNFQGTSSNQDMDTSAGILCHGPGDLRLEHVDVLDCTTGLSAGYGANVALYQSRISGDTPRSLNSSTSVGIALLYGAWATVGAHSGMQNTITNCGTGVHITRNSVAHVDFNTITDNYYGLQITHNARAAVIDGDFLRNMIGIGLSGGGELTYTTANFGTGPDANVLYNMKIGGTAGLTSYTRSLESAVEHRIYSTVFDAPTHTPTGTSRREIVVFGSHNAIPAGLMLGARKKIRVVLTGRADNSSGRRRFELSKNDNQSQHHQMLAQSTVTSALTGTFQTEFEVETTETPGQFRWISKTVSQGYTTFDEGTVDNIVLDHDWRLRIYQHNLDNANDTIKLIKAEVYVTG